MSNLPSATHISSLYCILWGILILFHKVWLLFGRKTKSVTVWHLSLPIFLNFDILVMKYIKKYDANIVVLSFDFATDKYRW